MGVFGISNGSELIHSYCFEVNFYVDNIYMEVGFAKISSIENSVEYETIIEGSGEIHIVPKHISQPKVITFSKGVASTSILLASDLLAVGKNIKEIIINIGDRTKRYDYVYRKYVLKDCVITKCSISDIDAMRSEALFETFEVSYLSKTEIMCGII